MRNKKGISLIVLVITIIVMIILATAIIISLDNAGIINRAKDAVEQTNLKQVQQLASLAWAEAYMEGKVTKDELKSAVNTALVANKVDTSKYDINVTTSGVKVQLKTNSKNEYGFYFDEAYIGEIDSILYGYVFQEDGKVQVYTVAEGIEDILFYSTEINVTYAEGQIVMGEMAASVSDDGLTLTSGDIIITCDKGIVHGIHRGYIYSFKSDSLETSVTLDDNNKGTMISNGTSQTLDMTVTADDHLLSVESQTFRVSIDGRYIYWVNSAILFTIEEKSNDDTESDADVVTYNPGLYDAEDNLLIAWSDLVANGTIHVNDGVITTNFDEEAFSNTSAETLTGILKLPTDGSVTSIDNKAFYLCGYMTGIYIPDSITSIGMEAFAWCGNVSQVKINKTSKITNIGDAAFGFCMFEEFTIPSGITTISESMFNNCQKLKSITINANITDIGDSAFSGCSSLTNVTFESNNKLKAIGNSVFDGCESLTSISLPSSVTSIGDSAFNGCALTSIKIPDGVTVISDSTFRECPFTSIEIPNSITSIGEYAFYKCANLTSVTFESNSKLESIGYGAFWTCPITSIDLPNSLKSIYCFAFSDCPLTTVVIPASVTYLESAFSSCESLISITMESATPPELVGAGLFDDDEQATIIYVPAGSVDEYKAAAVWTWHSDRIQAAP